MERTARGGVGDILALLVLVLLTVQAAIGAGSFGGGYRGVAFAVATVFGVRILATLLFGAVLLGPLTSSPRRTARSTGAGPWSAPTGCGPPC